MTPSPRPSLGEALLEARRCGTRITQVPEAPATLDEAYAVQAQLLRDLSTSEPLAGWKVGATSAGAQRFLGTTEPISGRVRRSGVHHSPAQLRYLPGLEAEPEVIFRLKPDMGAGDLRGPDAAREAVAACHVGLEINRPSYERPMEAGVLAIVADNAAHHGLVLGGEVSLGALAGLSVEVLLGGAPAGQGRAEDVLGDPVRSLAWLAGSLPAEEPMGGMLIAAGAMTRGISLEGHEALTARFSQGGEVALSLD